MGKKFTLSELKENLVSLDGMKTPKAPGESTGGYGAFASVCVYTKDYFDSDKDAKERIGLIKEEMYGKIKTYAIPLLKRLDENGLTPWGGYYHTWLNKNIVAPALEDVFDKEEWTIEDARRVYKIGLLMNLLSKTYIYLSWITQRGIKIGKNEVSLTEIRTEHRKATSTRIPDLGKLNDTFNLLKAIKSKCETDSLTNFYSDADIEKELKKLYAI